MTRQDCPPQPARLEISPPARYARAGAYVDEPGPADPARAKFLQGTGEAGSGGDHGGPVEPPAEPVDETADDQAPPAGERPPYFPLRRRGRNLRDSGHAAYYDAPTPAAGVAAAYDYARASCTRAEKGGMPIPAAEDALIDIGRALMAVGDSVTAAMETWRPAS